MDVGNVRLFLAMSHEVVREMRERRVAWMDAHDPLEDAVIVMESVGVPPERIAKHVMWMRKFAREESHRAIAAKHPEPEPVFHVVCPDCNESGVASYGYCWRCGAKGYLEVAKSVYAQCHSVGEVMEAAR